MRIQTRFVRRQLLLVGASLGSLLAFQPANILAQTYPTKAVRLVIPWAPGTPADVTGRRVADRMSAGLGQAVVVDNRPGATGTIGLREVLQQPADGYVIYMLSSASLVAPLLYPSQDIDFAKLLDPVGHVNWSYNVLVTPASSPFKSVDDLIRAARSTSDRLSFASGGNGTPAHLAGELLKQQAGLSSVHVPYNQFSMAIGDLIAGRVDYMFLTASAAVPQILGGKLRPLAVTGARRLPVLPDVPTMAEKGFSNFVLRSFDGMTVRHGTPRKIVERLNTELNNALAEPQIRDFFTDLGLESQPMTSQQFEAVIASEFQQWTLIGRAAKIKAD